MTFLAASGAHGILYTYSFAASVRADQNRGPVIELPPAILHGNALVHSAKRMASYSIAGTVLLPLKLEYNNHGKAAQYWHAAIPIDLSKVRILFGPL